MAKKETVGELVYRISGDMTELRTELGKSRQQMKRMESRMDSSSKKTKGLMSRFNGLKASVVAASAVIGYQLMRAFRFAINSATDLQESVNAVNVVFGEGAERIKEFGRTSAQTVGLAQADFNQLATRTGALLKDTGLTMDEVAGQTIELTRRAADLASVYNTDVNDALSAINQALRGETEAIRRYAGDVTDATLETYALSEGIQQSVTEMSQQEKRLLRVQLLMEQTADVAGDFERTSLNLANRQRILQAEITNLSAQLGTALIPALELLAGEALSTVDDLETTTDQVNDMGETFYQVAQGIIGSAHGVAQGFRVVVGAIQTLVLTVTSLFQHVISNTDRFLSSFGIDALSGFKDDIDSFLLDLEGRMDENRAKIDENAEKVTNALGQMLDPTEYEGISTEQVAEAIGGVGDATEKTGGQSEDAGEKVEDFSDKLVDLKDKAGETTEELEDKLSTAFDDFNNNVRDNINETVSTLATTFLDAENKLADLEEQLKDTEDDDEKDRLEKQIEEQEAILEQREGFEERQAERIKGIKESLVEAGIDAEEAGLDKILETRSLEEEIAEQRRLDSLNEFQRFEQQQAKKLATLTDNFIAETNLLKEKLKKQKSFEQSLTTFLKNEEEKRLENTEAWAQKTMDKYGAVASQLQSLISQETRLSNIRNGGSPTASSSVGAQGQNSQATSTTTNNTTNVSAPVTIGGETTDNIPPDMLSKILGFEISKRIE